MEPAGDLPDIFQCLRHAFRDARQLASQVVTVGGVTPRPGGLQFQVQQSLLEPVIQVTLKASPGMVDGCDDPGLAAPSSP
jgi:hypothetical protein